MKKKLAIVLVSIVIIFIILPFGISIYLYNSELGKRFETYKPLAYKIEDFEGLNRDKYEIISNKGQKLIGYNYFHKKDNIKGIVILAHGLGGGGHNTYMDCANYFAKSGFYAFAYDATGNDESEGKNVKGLPQGVIDLNYVITYIENQEEFKNLPIMLFGHSWGAYSATNVLNYHPEIKAVVSLAGFNKSQDLLESQGKQMVGGLVKIFMPYVNIYEKIKFGDFAINTSMQGFENSKANIMIVHSEDDNTVEKKYGYDIYYEKYSNSPRFTFILYKDKGHNNLFYSEEYIDYINNFNHEFKKYFEENKFSVEAKKEYLNKNLDRDKWCNKLDEELFEKIVKFYENSII